jgi:serine protease AprX
VGRLRSRARSFASALALAVLAALLAVTAPAGASPVDDCVQAGVRCYDLLPADGAWRDTVGLSRLGGKWDGDGVTVASIDTGVTPNPDLGDRLLARVDLTADHDGLDRFGHGTHMAGLIAGDGTTSDEVEQGAAPEANLVSVKVAGWDGATDPSTVIAALRWVVTNRGRYGIRVVNLSWGTDGVQPADVDPLNAAVERAWQAGLVVVVSAGNTGPADGTLTKPGDDPFVITVGAADTGRTVDPDDDQPAAFSSRGRARGGASKPDILAPGVSMVSNRAPGSTIDLFRPEARVGDRLFKGTGTSQAAAVVSGVAARLIQANPTATPNQIKAALMGSTRGRLAGAAGGAGLIDAAGAIDAVTARRGPALPSANPGLASSSGLGSLDASRGTHPVVLDADGDGTPATLSGEVDALGEPWSVTKAILEPWTTSTWANSPWASRVAVIPGSGAAPAWTGSETPLMAWETWYWGARSPQAAGWDAKYWGAKYWGAKYWGTGAWQ